MVIIDAISHAVGQSSSNIWRALGKSNIETFRSWFPSYFERYSLKVFLMMDNIHTQLTKMIKGANPPRMIAKESLLYPALVETLSTKAQNIRCLPKHSFLNGHCRTKFYYNTRNGYLCHSVFQ